MTATTPWTEIGDRVLVRRYAFFDQNIVAILDHDEALVVDTRSTDAQAREILDDLRELGAPRVGIVVNTHGHFDHAFGNRSFRPAVIWGHERSVPFLERYRSELRAQLATELPAIAEGLRAVHIDPPDRVFATSAVVEVGGRRVELSYLGRGHTDNDIVLVVPDADVLCAGDLLENDAAPSYGDAFPLDWPATIERLAAMTGERTVVVPGHGRHAGRSFVDEQLAGFRAVASLAGRVQGGELDLDTAEGLVPYPAVPARFALERALAQLRGELS